MTYLDSSVLLAIYLDQPEADRGRALLDQHEAFISSWLLSIEAAVVLRRLHAQAPAKLGPLLDRLDEDLCAVTLVDALADVAQRIRDDARLAACRSLDAIHVATALLVQEWTGRPVTVATFDHRMAEAARGVTLALAWG